MNVINYTAVNGRNSFPIPGPCQLRVKLNTGPAANQHGSVDFFTGGPNYGLILNVEDANGNALAGPAGPNLSVILGFDAPAPNSTVFAVLDIPEGGEDIPAGAAVTCDYVQPSDRPGHGGVPDPHPHHGRTGGTGH